jgi:L-lactate dehydrogenase complex protein LldG
MSGSREGILGRIREALRVPAPRHHGNATHSTNGMGARPFREWLPTVGAAFDEQLALFKRQSENLRSEFGEYSDPAAAAARIAELAAVNNWKRLALHAGELTSAIGALLPDSLEQVRIEHGYDKLLMESCDAGLSECESLVAQTGSVCVTSRSSGGRALSVLPPHHLVLARRAQLLPDLTAAYDALAATYGENYPSFISFISGPSRTGDIERILVLGAHGPKKLEIFLLP